MKLAVVIAAYNEEENLRPLTARLIESLDNIPDCQWRLIYVIEGTDRSRFIAEEFAARRPEIRVIYGEQPSGLANAFRKGFAAVPEETDFLVTMDADLNHQPEEIPRLLDALQSHRADIVVGSRKVPGSSVEGAPLWKRLVSDLLNRLMKQMMAMPVADQTSGFRIYRYPSFSAINYENTGFAFLPEILICAHEMGLRIREEPIKFVFRKNGRSKMSVLSTSASYTDFLRTLARSRFQRAEQRHKQLRKSD